MTQDIDRYKLRTAPPIPTPTPTPTPQPNNPPLSLVTLRDQVHTLAEQMVILAQNSNLAVVDGGELPPA